MKDPDSFVGVDASLKGWGAKYGDQTTQGIWSSVEACKHINCLELFAIQLALQSLCYKESNCHIRIFSDNMTAVCYINAMGDVAQLNAIPLLVPFGNGQ